MEKIKEFLIPYLNEHGFKLYSMKFIKEYGMKILQIIIDKDGGITVDELALANEFISERIDDNISDTEYMLEVSSRGAERVLEKEEWKLSIDQYVMVKAEKEIFGYLREVKDASIVMEINEKGRIRKIEIENEKINMIRLSVKF